jgi:hypothetical protein
MQPRPRSAPPTADPLSIVRPAPASSFRLAPRRLSGRMRPTAGTRAGRQSRLPCGRTALLTALTLSAVTTVRAQLPDSTTTPAMRGSGWETGSC